VFVPLNSSLSNTNTRRPGYPDSVTVEFSDVVLDTGLAVGAGFTAKPAKFRVIAHTDSGDVQLDFRFRDFDNDGTLSRIDFDSRSSPDSTDLFDVLTYQRSAPTVAVPTYRMQLDTTGVRVGIPLSPPQPGDRWDVFWRVPLHEGDVFTFQGRAEYVDAAVAQAGFGQDPYVVPNPYIESASFEPSRFAVSGRGVRRIEFRGLPQSCTVRIYTVRGDLVQTLRKDSADDAGMVAWDLRTKDNLDVAPGLYIFHVEAPGLGTKTGKFAVIK
jgi:hypothetical protein